MRRALAEKPFRPARSRNPRVTVREGRIDLYSSPPRPSRVGHQLILQVILLTVAPAIAIGSGSLFQFVTDGIPAQAFGRVHGFVRTLDELLDGVGDFFVLIGRQVLGDADGQGGRLHPELSEGG